jgi:hypothetical protein
MFLGSKERSARKAGNLAATCDPIVWTVESSASHKPIGVQGLLQG